MITYRGFCQIQGEERPRQHFGPNRNSVMDWVTKMTLIVPIGTTIEVYEVKETLVQQFVKHGPTQEQLDNLKELPVEKEKCYCNERVYCPLHPELGWQKGWKK